MDFKQHGVQNVSIGIGRNENSLALVLYWDGYYKLGKKNENRKLCFAKGNAKSQNNRTKKIFRTV